MKYVLALILALLPRLAGAQAPADAPVIRTTLNPAQGIVIGQPVRIDVQVLFPGEMVRPPLVSLPEAAGAQIFRFESQALTTRDSIDGRDYVGQVFEFVLFPRRGGTIQIPAAKVTLLNRSGDPIGTAQGSASSITVSVPQGIDASGPVLVADRVEVSQEWAPDPAKTKLVPGSALVRTIRRQADGVPAIGMAEFAFLAPEGVRVYADPPVADDHSNRGEVTGLRTDKVTYVFERGGSYDLPALTQPWWSLSSKQARTETLPGVAVTVAAAATASGRSRLWPAWVVGSALALAGIALLAICGWLLVQTLRSRRERYRSSAAFAQRQLLKASETGDPAITYRAFTEWRQRLTPGDQLAAHRDSALAASRDQLVRAVFGGRSWDKAAAEAFKRAVADWRRGADQEIPAEPLPPLNPAAGTSQ